MDDYLMIINNLKEKLNKLNLEKSKIANVLKNKENIEAKANTQLFYIKKEIANLEKIKETILNSKKFFNQKKLKTILNSVIVCGISSGVILITSLNPLFITLCASAFCLTQINNYFHQTSKIRALKKNTNLEKLQKEIESKKRLKENKTEQLKLIALNRKIVQNNFYSIISKQKECQLMLKYLEETKDIIIKKIANDLLEENIIIPDFNFDNYLSAENKDTFDSIKENIKKMK